MIPYTKNAWGRPRKLCMRPSTNVHEAVHVRCMRPFTSLRIFLIFLLLNQYLEPKAVCIWMHIVRKESRSWIHYHKQKKLAFIALEWKCYKRTRAISLERLYPVYLEEKRSHFELIIIWFSYNDVRCVTKTAVILVKISNLYFIFVAVLLLHKK